MRISALLATNISSAFNSFVNQPLDVDQMKGSANFVKRWFHTIGDYSFQLPSVLKTFFQSHGNVSNKRRSLSIYELFGYSIFGCLEAIDICYKSVLLPLCRGVIGDYAPEDSLMDGIGDECMQIQDQIRLLEKQYDCTVAVCIMNQDGTPVFEHSSHQTVKSASVIKLFIASVLLKAGAEDPGYLEKRLIYEPEEHADVGGTGILKLSGASSDRTVAEYIELMLCHSDNIATNILIKHLGLGNLSDRIRQQYADTRLQRRMYGFSPPKGLEENITTARDVAELMADSMEDGEVGEAMMKYLREADEEQLLAKGMPSDMRITVKSGILNDVYHECGLIIYGGKLFPFAVMTGPSKSNTFDEDRKAMYLRIGELLSSFLKRRV